MKERLVCLGGLVLALALVAGCRRTRMVSRPLVAHEVGWAEAIGRWYPGWRTPFFSPVRDAEGARALPGTPGYLGALDATGAFAPQAEGAERAVDEEVELVPVAPRRSAP